MGLGFRRFSWLMLVPVVLFSCSSSSKNRISKSETTPDKSTEIFSRMGIVPYAPYNEELLKSIYSWIGTPYQYGGNNRTGVDCSGLINNIYSEVYKIKLPRTTSELEASAKAIKADKLSEGDLVFFTINTKKAGHAGIYLSDGYFAHASTSRGVMISRLSEDYWKKYFSGAGRVILSNQ